MFFILFFKKLEDSLNDKSLNLLNLQFKIYWRLRNY